MDIVFKVGKEEVHLMDAQDRAGGFVLAKRMLVVSQETGETREEFKAFNWFTTLQAALDKILTLRLKTSTARSLVELKTEIQEIRAELLEVTDGI